MTPTDLTRYKEICVDIYKMCELYLIICEDLAEN